MTFSVRASLEQFALPHPGGGPQLKVSVAAPAVPTSGAAVPVLYLVDADLLFGMEGGLHRFHGLAGEACHAWVDLLEPRAELADPEWNALPGPPTPRPARGTPIREVSIDGERTLVDGWDLDVPWPELAARLEETSVARLLGAFAKENGTDALWVWERPLQAIEKMLAAQKGAGA